MDSRWGRSKKMNCGSPPSLPWDCGARNTRRNSAPKKTSDGNYSSNRAHEMYCPRQRRWSLGIDIGGLNGVLLGNVPPGRANHMQRAGRAGRRSDGSSLVVTFARSRPFDREVFLRFSNFISRKFRKQTVFLERPRIARRHLHAMLLAEFFAPRQASSTGAMDAYSNMGKFCGLDNGPERWTGAVKPDWTPSLGRLSYRL